MPSKMVHCVLCNRRERGARSKYTTIGTFEREQKVYKSYEERYGGPLNHSLFNRKVHVSCYKRLTFGQESVSQFNRAGRPKYYRNRRHTSTLSDMYLHHRQPPANDEENDLSNLQHPFTQSKIYFETFEDQWSLSDDENDFIPDNETMSNMENEIPINIVKHNSLNIFPNDTSFDSDYNDMLEPINATQTGLSPIDLTRDYETDEFDRCSLTFDNRSTDATNKSTNSSLIQNTNLLDEDNVGVYQDEFEQITNMEGKSEQIRCNKETEAPSLRRSTRTKSNNITSSSPEVLDKSIYFFTAFEELCDWLMRLLYSGCIVSMVDVSAEYQILVERRREKLKKNMFRTSSIQDRLKWKYGDLLHFEKTSNNEGIYVGLSDSSVYIRYAISKLKIWERSKPSNPDEVQVCEQYLKVIEELRNAIKNNAHIFESMKHDSSSLINLDSDVFWRCVPLLLKNFIGMLTLSNRMFARLKNEYAFYDIQTKDLFRSSAKWLKIASICQDLIYISNQQNIMPKHYLLGNELYRHERSEQLLTIINRLGHTASYSTISRLQKDAAKRSRTNCDPFYCARPDGKSFAHNFIVKVADNFDINPDRLHGDKSIHLLTQIIVSTPENDEIPMLASECINDLVDLIVESEVSAGVSSTQESVQTQSLKSFNDFPNKMFMDNSLNLPILAYGLIKFANDSTRTSFNYLSSLIPASIPILSGFFATYLNTKIRPLHYVSFMTPINEDPSSLSTAKRCLEETKELFVDSEYEKESVLVVDEKIYRSCMKVKHDQPDTFKNIFVYVGDFHLMKNMMVVIWSVLKGSGIESILENIYKGATLRSIFDVRHFNKSLRCCKLLYTALHILWLEAYFDETLTTSETIDCIHNLKSTMTRIPSEYKTDDIAQAWFTKLLQNIEESNLSEHLHAWTTNSIETNSTFRLWYFVLNRLLQPLLQLYMAIRTCNFSARNAALYQFAPLFFSTNHRNYSRLCAQHVFDLQMSSSYLLERMARSFAVTRSRRRFSSIALDQTIEVTINKHGKGSGGINGQLDEESMDNWVHSFAFRALLTSNLQEICSIETVDNSIDSHVECAPNRKAADNEDLSIIVKKLRNENLFTKTNRQCRKILSGLIIHDDIIMNISSLHERGQQALLTYIYERLVHKTIPIDAPLKAMDFLKLKHADTYVPTNIDGSIKGRSYFRNIKNFNQLAKLADLHLRRTIIVAKQRNLRPLSQLFAFEFSPVPLSLCDSHNIDLFYQQTKTKAIEFLNKIFPWSFSFTCPITTQQSALVMDGNILLEVKPNPGTKTIRDYATQLLKTTILYLFQTHNRIDIVFETIDSKNVKQFIKKHEHDLENPMYQLKGNDRLESPFGKFVHSHRACVAECIRQCWMETNLIQLLPSGRVLVVAGPGSTAVKIQNGHAPELDYLLESTHSEASTRMLLHANVISLDQCCQSVFIKTTDTDVILLAIAFATSINLAHLIVKSTNTRTKKETFINVKPIAADLRSAAIDPTCLLVLHAISGCDTTSFIKGITKENIFQRFFDDPIRYASINQLTCIPPPYEAIEAAEQLLIRCYSFSRTAHSLDELRSMVVDARIKDLVRTSIATSLPPSTAAFHQHCLRAARQLKIWIDCLDSNPTIPPMIDLGYENSDVVGKFRIKWTDLPDKPIDSRLDSCGECKSNCTRCNCFKRQLPCTLYCKCNSSMCNNQSSLHSVGCFSKNNLPSDDIDDDTCSIASSVAGDSDSDQVSIMSDPDSIHYQSDDSDIDTENFDSTVDTSDHGYYSINTTSQSNLPSHIFHDHNYAMPDSDSDRVSNSCITSKRKRTSSMATNIFESPIRSSSDILYSTPRIQLAATTSANLFKTPHLPSRSKTPSTTQSSPRFRKKYGMKFQKK